MILICLWFLDDRICLPLEIWRLLQLLKYSIVVLLQTVRIDVGARITFTLIHNRVYRENSTIVICNDDGTAGITDASLISKARGELEFSSLRIEEPRFPWLAQLNDA